MSSQKKFYTLLGLEEDATLEEIKKSFKELAFKYHPDRNPHTPWAAEKFKEIAQAYAYLSGNQEALRALQSTTAREVYSSQGPGKDILESLLGQELKPAALSERPLEMTCTLSLKEAFLGCRKKVSFFRDSVCDQCLGRGVEPGAELKTCVYCFGFGEVESLGKVNSKTCPKCSGRGIISSRGCVKCRAHGVQKERVHLKIEIPPRICPGDIVRIHEQGHAISKEHRGPLTLKVQLIPDDRFTFDGKDIICEIELSVSLKEKGGTVKVPTLAGRDRKIEISDAISSAGQIRLKDMGLGGDLVFVIKWLPEKAFKISRKKIRGGKEISLLSRLFLGIRNGIKFLTR